MRLAMIVFAILLAGCRQAAVPGPAPTPSDTPSPDLTPVATLAGEWRVAGIDGEPFDESYGLALSGDGEELWWSPRCARQARSYRMDGLAVSFMKPEDAGKVPGSPPCLPPVPSRLADVMGALDAAARVERTPENGVLISGGGRSLLLFSQ